MVGGGGNRMGEWWAATEPQSSHSKAGAHMDNYEGSRNLNEKLHPSKQRLLVVANRLPVSAIRLEGDKWDLQLSAGGLVSALLGVKHSFETRWIGWPGVSVHDEKGRASLTEALALKGCVPVFLDDDTVDQYYNGYCNNVLWPLFHYIGLPQADRLAATRSLDSQFQAYQHANSLFAKIVFSQYQEGDVVWCHDYHLMCLPQKLKELNPHMKVGWFLHTPFPSSEIYRTLPLRSELLKAVLTADLIGFHTYDYARHFVSACTRILGLEGTPEGVEDQGKLTRVAAFPIGIDPERFISALETEQVKLHVKELLRFFAGRKVMLGVDRLDMIKGIPQKLLAFEMFLEKNPQWREKVMLVQIAVPTRTDVHEYQRLTSQVHEIVGRINGRFGTVTFVPINHLDRSLAFHELCALYASTDVVLVTSLRDGMNLVSYEYVACQHMKNTEGVLVLSEFAGAAQSLGAGAILVNPWNIREMYKAIEEALTMSDEERKERHRHNFTHVMTHTAQAWAVNFVSELNDTYVEAELRTLNEPPVLPVDTAKESFRRCTNRLLIFGFNSTITAAVEAPRRDQIKESKLGLHPGMKDSLKTLCSDPNTDVVILSGSRLDVLEEVFGEYGIWLAAENGMYLRDLSGNWMPTMEHLNMDWKEYVQRVFDYFCQRTPRSYVEKRETSLVWNYKYADVDFGKVQARNMLQHLWTGPISNAAVDVVQGQKSVEVRPIGVSKGAAIDRIVFEILRNKYPNGSYTSNIQFDFVMCVGHFLSKDEDVFAYFDPEIVLHRDYRCSNGKMERNLDPRLPAKSYDRVSSKSNKTSVVRTKTYPLISPDHNGSHSSSSHSRSNSSKDGSIYSYSDRDLMGDLVNVSSDTYISCAVGKKRSSARYYLDTVNEVVSFVKSLADACPCELDSEDQSVLSVGSGSGPHVSPCSADSLPNGIPRHDL
ncbi:alpha,alpha-trehalose-phosphate synthase [UDP-forming] 1 [Physcomitrium patens]|nr:alpha,alpha-trehalose-phosphate synthase [UDP-forming] 1-like [Physcomitrium patens]XP_024375258.1 alpha,alpha-trehalose-phosphate synthase [UDP-forming] 1-like [Physcomitrium patens]XP_024375260.1 alpha,alpha-trehalose-phosphate synthase [UDP-forming] 1-like [Physcomitrium patens]XP_024375261.1 alpha,alpha-trehalose-phosphate synthase [UDP-forming] 1-like [Physcomitrium patens]XP_024375262.1 alpha,alpha-trehalose-phosphate synthase [UDP-forming] 1-like [Physcomitrium patens]XP_024375263.1 |eukprot:XP_024375257.1 alpha,alpha-trehalose-phosphate synthase [UDP-forming] 1-like [Physcomitrella patens]